MSALRKGQSLRPIHPDVAEREWGVSCDSVGAILCSYRVHSDPSGTADRVDVRFDDGLTVWGAPACEFIVVGEAGEALRKH
jgi:hypothetical protein